MNFCKKCGAQMQGKYCTVCGTKSDTFSVEKNTDTPKLATAIPLLFLIWLMASGGYLNAGFEQTSALLYGFIDLIVATALMMSYPFVSRIINKEPIEYRECRTICIANSVILFIVSLILQITIGFNFIGGIGALIYYFINMSFFSAHKIKK